MPSSERGPRGGRGCKNVEDRFISTAGRQLNRERGPSPNSIHRATTAAATIRGYHPNSNDNPMMVNAGIYVYGWQPRPPFLNCSERSFRSRPPELLDQNDPFPPDHSQRPAALLGSFVPHAFQQLEPRAGGTTNGVVNYSTEEYVFGRCHQHHRHLQQEQQREICIDRHGSCETFSGAAGSFCSTPHHSIGSYAQEGVDNTMNLTNSMATLATDSSASATSPLTGQHHAPSACISTCSERLHAISTWWTGHIEQAVVFASAYRSHNLDGRDGRCVEKHLAALLADTFLDAACQNVHGHGIEQLRRESDITQRNPRRETDAPPPLLPNRQTSDEGGEEKLPVLSQGAAAEDPVVRATRSCPSRSSFAREFVAEVMRAGFLQAVPIAVATGWRPTVPLAIVEDEEKPTFAVPATTPQADGTSHIPEKGAEEQPHQQQQAEVHDGHDLRCSDVIRVSSPATSNDGTVTARQIPSLAPPTVTTHGSAAAVTDISVGQRTRSSSAAATTRNSEERRCTPPSSRKRFRNGTFVRIINVPVNSSTAIVGHTSRFDAANHDGKQEPREGAGCWRPSPVSQHSSRDEAPPTVTKEPRPRPRTAVTQEGRVVGVGGGSVSPVASRKSDMEVKRKAKSAGAARSAAGLGGGGRSAGRGGARLQLRRHRWCSPTAVVVGGGGCLHLEASVTSLRTTPSPGGGGCGSSRETLQCPAVDGDTHKVSNVDATTPRRPTLRVQAHHTFDAHGSVGRGIVTNNSGVDDGALSGTTRMLYGVAIGGEGVGGAKQVTGEEVTNLSSTSSLERVFPPMSYEYKHHVKGLGPQDRTGLYATAGAAVTAAASAAVATAAAATERSEREGFAWRNGSNSSRADGTQYRGGSVASSENAIGRSWETYSGGTGVLRVVPPPKPPIGIKQAPLANSRRPGRTFALRP